MEFLNVGINGESARQDKKEKENLNRESTWSLAEKIASVDPHHTAATTAGLASHTMLETHTSYPILYYANDNTLLATFKK